LLAQGRQAQPPTGAQVEELIRQANALKAKGAYGEAAGVWEQILAIREKVLGPEHPDTATSLNNLAFLYRNQGRHREVEPLYKRSLAIIEKVLGAEHLYTATILNNLASLYESQGRYVEVDPIYKRSLAIREKVLGMENPDIADSLNNLAELYRNQGRYGEAEPLYKRSLAIREKVLGPEHPDTSQSLNNLAALYRAQGRYGWAEPLYKRSLAIIEKALGPEDSNTAASLNNLALLYDNMGRYGEAEPLYKRSLAIREKVLGAEHLDTAQSLNNLALLYLNQGRYDDAEPLYKRTVAIVEKVLGTEDPLTATSLNGLAVLYLNQGRYGDAEPLYKRSLAIREKVLGVQHPSTATSLNNLAAMYDNQGRYGEAEPVYKRSLTISEKVLGPEHPNTAASLTNLALLYLSQSNSTDAIPLLQRHNRHQANWLLRELPLQPRELRSTLIDKQPDAIGSTFALLDQSPSAAPLALETRLNRQGLLAEIERLQAQLKGSSPETRQLAEQVAGIDRLLASVSLPPAQREPLRQQRQQLESKLYRLLPALKIDPVTTTQVAAALKASAPQGLLVEFQKYQPWGKGAKGKGEWGPPRYVALLLRPDGSIRSIPLGAAEPIDAAIADAVAASASSDRQREASQRLAAVSQLLLQPLQAELNGVQELFVSPDGELNRLPFAALPMAAATGPTLGESLQLRLLTTGRELVRLQQPGKAGNATTLISNPDFGAPSRSAKSPQAPPAALQDLGPWAPLPGTATEAAGLTPMLRPPAAISGRAATATLVAQQKGPRILHIATHGFFLAPQKPTAGTNTPAPSLSFEPLQRSGLVFAGANQNATTPAGTADQDAYLTAAEATAMDLQGTELVTLSACETARGGVRSGEGVYGLQRALAVAGARSTLLSLWKVDDDLTALFMEEFYKRLKAGEGRADALRNTQTWFRRNGSSTLRDVRVWGAFQLSGDWRPITGW
jgi:CHAT domain-containing protein/tetratricopeptide (TPR) repeat protein